MILSLLPLCEKLCVRLTCRRLYSLASDTSLWNHVAWRYYTPADEKLLKTALKLSAPHVRELQLHATTGYLGQYSKISGILKRCRNLRSLSLRGYNMKANQLKTLVSALPQLSDVRIGKSLKTYLSLQCMGNYMEAAKSLKSLIIELPNDVHWLNRISLETLVSQWASLGYCPPEFGMVINSFISPCLLRDAQHMCLRDPQNQLPPSSHKARFCLYTTGLPMDLSPLQPVCELTFHRSCVIAHGESIGLPRSHFMLMGKTLESENYTIAHSFNLKPGFPCHSSQIASFTTFSHHLTTLKLQDLGLSAIHLELIADTCPNLTDLDIPWYTKAFKCLQGLAAIAHKCTQLKGLTINTIIKSSNEEEESIPAFWEILAQIRKLEYLTVSDGLLQSNLDDDINSQSNIRMKRSFQQMKSLCALQVQCCTVTNRELSLLSNLASLTYLRLSDLPPSQIGLEEILGKAQQLKYLYISKLSNAGKLTLPTHASCYTNLEQVFIRCWNFAVTDVLVKALVHSGKLTHLFLLIGSISQRNVTDLIQNLPRLAVCQIYVHLTVGPRGSAKQFKTALQSLVKSRGLAQFDFKPNVCRHNSIGLCWDIDELLDYTELTPLNQESVSIIMSGNCI